MVVKALYFCLLASSLLLCFEVCKLLHDRRRLKLVAAADDAVGEDDVVAAGVFLSPLQRASQASGAIVIGIRDGERRHENCPEFCFLSALGARVPQEGLSANREEQFSANSPA